MNPEKLLNAPGTYEFCSHPRLTAECLSVEAGYRGSAGQANYVTATCPSCGRVGRASPSDFRWEDKPTDS
jgi:hypothetical protein